MDFDTNMKNTIDFLMFHQYGVTFEDETKYILKTVVDKAYKSTAEYSELSLKSKGKGAEYDKWYEEIKNTKSFQAVKFLLKEWTVDTVIETLPKMSGNIHDWDKARCEFLSGEEGFDYIYEEIINANKEELKYSDDFGSVRDGNQYFTYRNAQMLQNITFNDLYSVTSIAALYSAMNVQNVNAERWYKKSRWNSDSRDLSKDTVFALGKFMYVYFGADSRNSSYEILRAAIGRAYDDATKYSALSLKSKGKSAEYDKWYENIKNKSSFRKVKSELKEWAIDAVLLTLSEASKDFDAWHKELCDTLAGDEGFDYLYGVIINANKEELEYSDDFGSVCDGNQYFTYGNAQMFVNGALRNLYLITNIAALEVGMTLQNEKAKKSVRISMARRWHERYKWIVEQADKFHIPLDDTIYTLAGIDSKKERWNKIADYAEYEAKRKIVAQKLKSLSDACPKWIAQAKKEKRAKANVDKAWENAKAIADKVPCLAGLQKE